MAKKIFLKLIFGRILAGSYVTDTSKVRWAKNIRMEANSKVTLASGGSNGSAMIFGESMT